TSGGLGPTEDDLTREAIAAVFGETPRIDPDLERQLETWFAGRGMPMPERNRKQAWLIPSARAIPNPNGTAPGWDTRRDGKRIVSMPGVPREMTYMWEHHIEPSLRESTVLRSRTLKLLGIGESHERRRWRLATAEALSAGDVSRVLTQAPRANEWFMTGVVIPHAAADSLARAIEHSEAQVTLLVPHGDASAEITVTTPERPRTATVKFASPTEGRRRALLTSLDLLRRAVAE